MHLQSQTWSNLRQLLGELPKRRVRLFVLVLLASLVQGLVDVCCNWPPMCELPAMLKCKKGVEDEDMRPDDVY